MPASLVEKREAFFCFIRLFSEFFYFYQLTTICGLRNDYRDEPEEVVEKIEFSASSVFVR